MQTKPDAQPQIKALPPILDLSGLTENFGISKSVAYALAAAGEIESLTLGNPGKRGSRRFLTSSVLAYIERRRAASPKLGSTVQCGEVSK